MGCGSSSNGKPKINDKAKDRGKFDEIPDEVLPDGEVGDCLLGVNVEPIKSSPQYSEDNPFVDDSFPADESSIFYSHTDETITWARPKDIVESPCMLVDGATKSDIVQGVLGDCWFLSSCASICINQDIMQRILPGAEDVKLSGDGYTGMIRIQFWRFGKWTEVIIDDQLPVQKIHENKYRLVFARSQDENEFWVSFVEKAYAKLHGSYEAIVGGQSMDALIDLTGGIGQRSELNNLKANERKLLYKHLLRTYESGGFITVNKDMSKNDVKKTGLVAGHAYSVTSVMQVRNSKGKHNLVRIRNPWGDGMEWKGAWSDNDQKNWNSVVRSKEIHNVAADGEFWMDFKNVCEHFSIITTCTLNPDLDGDGDGDKALPVQYVHGQWSSRSAGGSRNDIKSFVHNPQYAITITEPDDFDNEFDDPETKGKCSMVISLMQEYRRSQKKKGVKMLQIGYVIYKVDSPGKIIDEDYVMYTYDSGTSGLYLNIREITSRFDLRPGHYVVIPTTFKANEHGEFMLRVFCGSHFSLTGPINK